jgi:RNA 2',3'-cyclic 3'-phosphodiesterase
MLERAGNEDSRANQRSFGFAGAASARISEENRSHLFLAVVPEPDIAVRSLEIGRHVSKEYGLSGDFHRQDKMHVSLNGIGRYPHLPEDVVSTVCAAVSTVKAMPFEVSFDRVMSLANGSTRPLVLCSGIRSEEMMDLHVQLAKEMWSAGLIFTYNPRFKPHMTLLCDEDMVPERILTEPVRWTVREFVLVHSLAGQGRHEYLGRWPLLG